LERRVVGLTVLDVEVGNPANPETTEKIEFLIDSGAIYSVVPTPVLERLGIRPLATQEFRLADGLESPERRGAPSSGMASE
jgi:predicted aspartyl protease